MTSLTESQRIQIAHLESFSVATGKSLPGYSEQKRRRCPGGKAGSFGSGRAKHGPRQAVTVR